ncbi:MAG: CpsD/CapB family tyrosine-protein kinase [Clostridiales bacterium]|nr:CpsD/CapB family tyrosine-protein kinase [Roseburia sp.]MDD7636320.1 CpsD/CapB family tyrosine-protein kinase [Clostridiales bacterium]MDY4112632.1 CpsD/CapB family tyrosine-protein kinase [Roseburia sp.]
MESIELRNIRKHSYTKTESLRALKTNLQFCGDDVKTILFTSSIPDEGKSTVTFDLARSLTESGKSVLLIDTDMRKSVLAGRLRAKTLEKSEIQGLSHYLSGQKKLTEVLYATQIPKLFMIFAGPSVPNPTEILEKKYFAELIEFAREQFDYVLIDCAPIGAAIDAAIVAKHCDGAVLVIAQGVANSRMISSVKKQLEASGVRILGAVLNKVKMENNHYGKYYGRYYGSYYGSYYGNYYKRDDVEESI